MARSGSGARSMGGAVYRMVTKIGVSGLFGVVAYFLSQAVNPSVEGPALLTIGTSVFISGIAFVVQFLIDVEGRIDAVGEAVQRAEDRYDAHSQATEITIKEEFRKISAATGLFAAVEASALKTDTMTQLVRNSTTITTDGTEPLVADFAQVEINRLSGYLKSLGQGADVTYEGEDRDWLLGLTRVARTSIDATSLTTVDAGGRGYVDGGLWMTDLGQQYIDAQRAAIRRGVVIRRVFILDRPDMQNDAEFMGTLRMHTAIGVDVRILDPTNVEVDDVQRAFFDFIVFDGVLSYQVLPASGMERSSTIIATTSLVSDPIRVGQRIERYRQLWDSAKPSSPPIIPAQPVRR